MSAAESKCILVDGATGYLGSHLIHRLVQDGYAVRALVHPGARQNDIEFLKQLGAQVFTGDLQKPDDGSISSLSGCVAAVHLIGSVAPKKGERLDDLHTGQTRNLVDSCKSAGVKRIVMITTLGARENADNSYQATKWLAENEIRKSGLEYVILRPPLLFGRQVGHRDSKLVRRYRELISTKKMVPLINGGKNKIQPLFIGDLVHAICLALESKDQKVVNQALDIGGPQIMSLRQFVEELMESMGLNKPIVSLHPAIAGVLAAVCEKVQDVPTLSCDQVKLALADNICSDNALSNVLKVDLTPVKKGLESYNLVEPKVPVTRS